MAQSVGFNYISDLLFLYGWAEHGLRPMLADAGLGRNGQDIYSTYPPTSSLIKSNRKFHLPHKPADIFCDAQNCNPTFLTLGPTHIRPSHM